MAPSVSPGMRVFDVFHRVVGRVTGVHDDVAIGLSLATGEEIWLRRDVLFTVEENAVTLVCNVAQLDDYRWHNPT